jgi:hypothetical protein
LGSPESLQEFAGERQNVEARIIDAVGEVGPRNISEISRLTHVHPETVRYKFRKRFNRLGFRFHAEVDYERLGLTLRWATFRLSPVHYSNAPHLFRLLNRVGYLNYFGKVVPSGSYVARFGVPNDLRAKHESLFSWLMSEGILSSFSLQEARVSRHLTMNPRFFDFKSNRWEIPWKELRNLPARPMPLASRKAALVEDFDLLILKELQKDSTRHISSIARELDLNGRTLEYHYRTHVIARRLIHSYFVRWTQDTSKTLAHTVALTRLTFRPEGGEKLKWIQSTVSKVPFLWMEDLVEDGSYVASMYVPSSEMLPFLGYLNDELGDLGAKVETEFVKTNEASSFTIPYEMWRDGGWGFDLDEAKAVIRKEYGSSPKK